MTDILDNDVPAWSHKSRRLCTDLRFKTYSDAKLAGLFLENYFPIALFKKVFDVIVDPEFDSDDVTFGGIWDMFSYISTCRQTDVLKRDAALAPLERDGSSQTAMVPRGIPQDILGLVVDQVIDDRVPLGIAAMDPSPDSALDSNGSDLRNMTLVHRSWTSVAQRGLRRRAVIPIQYIDDFLLSPLCGSWITEMIIYWTFNDRDVGAAECDIQALESLLERTPNVRSLVFNTSLVWSNGHPPPSWRIDTCLGIIIDFLPNLENLWLKHHRPLTSANERLVATCGGVRSLYHYLPKLSSLKYLSIRWWSSDALFFPTNNDSGSDLQLNWDEHPPPQLKTVDLYLSGFDNIWKDDLTWLLKPRNSFSLDSLSIYLERKSLDFVSPSNSSSLHAAMRDCLPGIEKSLKLVIRKSLINNVWPGRGLSMSVPGQFYSHILKSASNLENLEMFFFQSNLCSVHGPFDLPPSLEILTIHLEDNYDHASTPTSTPASPKLDLQDLRVWFNSAGIEKFILERLSTLPRLCKIFITRSPPLDQDVLEDWDLDALTNQPYHIDQIAIQRGIQRGQDIISDSLHAICRERNIDFVFVDNAFPRAWDIPREEQLVY